MIPYLVMMIFAGFPVFYLELTIGQYAELTPLKLYKLMSPVFAGEPERQAQVAGIGVSMVVISIYTGVYYNVIIAWSLRYLFASFTGELPWAGCKHDFNDIRSCVTLMCP